jgi:hypothetical protein
MAENQHRPVFTYQTRLSVTPEQDQMAPSLRPFGHIERALFRDLERGKDSHQLKSEYLRRLAITARQFNALRIQLQGKIAALAAVIPLRNENQKRKIRKAKKAIAKLVKSKPGSERLHEKRRRLAHQEWRLEQLEAGQKAGRARLCFGSKKLFRAQFYLQANGYPSHAAWYADWTEARSRQFFVLGSKPSSARRQRPFAPGVEVLEVNPAYTSTIGAVNYAHRYGIGVHQGAAIAIARRSLALSERPDKRVAHIPTRGGDHVSLLLPERNRSKHVWSLWSKVSRQMRAVLAAHLRLLPRTARSTPPAWSCQPPCAS